MPGNIEVPTHVSKFLDSTGARDRASRAPPVLQSFAFVCVITTQQIKAGATVPTVEVMVRSPNA